ADGGIAEEDINHTRVDAGVAQGLPRRRHHQIGERLRQVGETVRTGQYPPLLVAAEEVLAGGLVLLEPVEERVVGASDDRRDTVADAHEGDAFKRVHVEPPKLETASGQPEDRPAPSLSSPRGQKGLYRVSVTLEICRFGFVPFWTDLSIGTFLMGA